MITTSHKGGCVYLFSATLLNFLGYIIPKDDQRLYCLRFGFVNQKICEIELTSSNPNILKKCAASGNVYVQIYVSPFIWRYCWGWSEIKLTVKSLFCKNWGEAVKKFVTNGNLQHLELKTGSKVQFLDKSTLLSKNRNLVF